MTDHGSMEPTHGLLIGAPRMWASLALLAVALAMTVPIYGGWLSGDAHRAFRYGLTLLWGGLALAATRFERTRPYFLSCLAYSASR